MNLKKKAKIYNIVFITVIVLTLVLCGVRMYILKEMVDPLTEFYTKDSLIPTIFNTFSVVIVAFVIIFSWIYKISVSKDIIPEGEANGIYSYTKITFGESNLLLTFINFFTGFMFLLLGILAAYYYIKFGEKNTLSIISIAFAVLSSAFYISSASGKINCHSAWFSLISLFPVAFAALRMTSSFLLLSQGAQIAAKLYEILSFAAMTLFFLNEAKLTLPDRDKHNMSRYYASGIIAFLTLFVYSVPELYQRVINGIPANETTIFLVLNIVVSLYAVIKLFNINEKLKNLE